MERYYFSSWVWNYVDFDQYIKAITKQGAGDSTKYPVPLEFDTTSTTFTVTITSDPNCHSDLTKSFLGKSYFTSSPKTPAYPRATFLSYCLACEAS